MYLQINLQPLHFASAKRIFAGVGFAWYKISKYQIKKKKKNENEVFINGEKKVYFYFFKRPKSYNQEVLSHSLICLPFPHMEGIVLICNTDLYCVIAIFNGTGDMFER